MLETFVVGLGGFIGASGRYLITKLCTKLFGSSLPYGTLLVNVTGGILMGLIMEISISTNLIPPNLRLFLTTGILGGLTTFSTFSYETISMVNSGKYSLALLNAGLNLFLSLLGIIIGKYIVQIA
ncbi:MAG: fluoride efflux transporter CrcB [Bacillota bacterium]|nr:fluoride efflux transporter CrcB [Bacillota bacterium]